MPPDRFLTDVAVGETPTDHDAQQLVEAESGEGTQGIFRRWQASDSNRVVLTSDSTGVKISRDNGTTAPAQVLVDGTAAGGSLTGTYPNPQLSAATIDAICPPGMIMQYAVGAAPSGWLACSGQAVSRTTYAKLYAVIGTLYGAGDGSTTFNVPNLRGRVALGESASHAIASTGGAETVGGPAHTHPGSHSHGMNAHTHGMNGHTHGMQSHTHSMNSHTHSMQSHTHSLNGHDHTVNIDHNHGAITSDLANVTGTLVPTAGGVISVSQDTHRHSVDLPGLGTTNVGSGQPSTPNTGTPSLTETAAPSPGGTSAPSPDATAAPSPGATAQPSPTDTSTDATAHGASASTIATMPPFLTIFYIIRAG